MKYKVKTYDISILPSITVGREGNIISENEGQELLLEEIICDEYGSISSTLSDEQVENPNESNESNESKGDNAFVNFIADKELGKLGEYYIEKRLLEQQIKDARIKLVKMVSDTPVGYDIEVTMNDGTIIGIEVKSSRGNGCTFGITNNELQKMSTLKDRHYLIIVVYDKKSDIVRYVYRSKNFLASFGVDSVKELTSTKRFSNVSFYPQVFVATINKEQLDKMKLTYSGRIID